MSAMMLDLIDRIRAGAEEKRVGPVFPNARGNAYTAQAFKLGLNRLKTKAVTEGALTLETNSTFHDLRYFYVTQFKKRHKELPELHAEKATTARVYDSSTTVQRKSL